MFPVKPVGENLLAFSGFWWWLLIVGLLLFAAASSLCLCCHMTSSLDVSLSEFSSYSDTSYTELGLTLVASP